MGAQRTLYRGRPIGLESRRGMAALGGGSQHDSPYPLRFAVHTAHIRIPFDLALHGGSTVEPEPKGHS
ncbi:hypothetical protein SAMN04487905_108167 [Actinopolyspora xinjiangensis]|uniref:Uncharacterized protein n=1 Tax=Actinopolyspora xinjiangensis TaxID=405564 RepID=A0A1H0VBR0_9ACTN|nr:hypothetical protein SAMN04487905_108167 [Actinopolyspora xinjiangensis]